MKKLSTSEKIYIANSKITKAGRGVFARTTFKKGDVIERCPVIEIPKNDVSNLGASILINYYFYFGYRKQKLAIALGFGSIYNHSYNPNATYKTKPENKRIDFIAIKNIRKNEEITVNYNFGNPLDNSPLWIKNIPPPDIKS